MINLKKVRKGLGLNQYQLAEILGCTQAFISQIENNRTELPTELEAVLNKKYGEKKMAGLNSSKTLKVLGWKNASDPEYPQLRQELLSILEKIQSKTNYSIDEISRLVYRNNSTIADALASGELSPNMAKYITKHLDKIGLLQKDVLRREEDAFLSAEQNVLHFESIKNFLAFLKKKEVAKAKFDLWINDNDVDYYINSPIEILPKISLNDILGIKAVQINEEVQFGKLYLIKYKDNNYSIQFIHQDTNPEMYKLSYEFPPKAMNAIKKESIAQLFLITSSIKIQQL
ncbi:helix-turn-helix domain-containing protein [Arachidicoccus sp.]|uniref:helix-turn-helix domain-containing protein n=1 Tax=Arachidicoccus sp. TaxID=1872624 RepID=UPI003D1B4D0D